MRNIYLILMLISLSCAQADGRKNENTHDSTSETKQANNVEVQDEIEISEEEVLKDIIAQKLQDIYDLNAIVSDSTLPKEMRYKARVTLSNLTEDVNEYWNAGDIKVSDVKLLPNNRVGEEGMEAIFKINNENKVAVLDIKNETVFLDGDSVVTYKVNVNEIKSYE